VQPHSKRKSPTGEGGAEFGILHERGQHAPGAAGISRSLPGGDLPAIFALKVPPEFAEFRCDHYHAAPMHGAILTARDLVCPPRFNGRVGGPKEKLCR
jgi:hypothetical protein